MKTFLPLLSVLVLCAVPALRAQETYGTKKFTTRLFPDGSKSTIEIDPDAHSQKETLMDAGGKVRSKTVYQLGDRDLPAVGAFYDAKDRLLYKVSYQRNGSGLVTEADFSGPDDRYLGKRIYVYGNGGNAATQIIDYDANGQMIAPAQAAQKSTKKASKGLFR